MQRKIVFLDIDGVFYRLIKRKITMNQRIVINLALVTTFIFLFTDCKSRKENDNSLMQIDVSASYPEKEIMLEEVADIEYLQLEFDEDYLFSNPPCIVTSQKIIISDRENVLIFSRNGKPLSKFNRKGQGPGEYTYIYELLYDETSDEVFLKSEDKFLVYSSSGKYKRTFPLLGRFYDIFSKFVNYDSETILLYDDDAGYPDNYSSAFSFISKKNGSVVDSIMIPKGKRVAHFAQTSAESIVYAPPYWIVKHRDGYLLTDYSIDTVYFFSREKKLTPILVRKPNIQSMNTNIILNSMIEAGNYNFFLSITIKAVEENGRYRLPSKYLMRDKKTGSVYQQKITFKDYQGKIINISPKIIENTKDSRLGLVVLDLTELIDANAENKISGKLKELVENSDELGNDILILLHFK